MDKRKGVLTRWLCGPSGSQRLQSSKYELKKCCDWGEKICYHFCCAHVGTNTFFLCVKNCNNELTVPPHCQTKKEKRDPTAPHLLLETWLSLVEEKLWFFLPSFITLKASSALFTWTQRRSVHTEKNKGHLISEKL